MLNSFLKKTKTILLNLKIVFSHSLNYGLRWSFAKIFYPFIRSLVKSVTRIGNIRCETIEFKEHERFSYSLITHNTSFGYKRGKRGSHIKRLYNLVVRKKEIWYHSDTEETSTFRQTRNIRMKWLEKLGIRERKRCYHSG